MITRTVRRQLFALAVVGLAAMTLLGTRYLGIPQKLGLGTYDVTVAMPAADGLYGGAPVRHRGVQIGAVDSTALAPQGVQVVLRIGDDHRVAASARVAVRHGSVIGEPYVELLPPADPTTAVLADGDTLAADRVDRPVSTASMLIDVRDLLGAVPTDDLRVTLAEAATALGGPNDPLGRIIDDGAALTAAAAEAQQPTTDLVDHAQRVLATQDATRAEIRAWAEGLSTVSGALADSDADVRALLGRGDTAVDAVTSLVADVGDVLPSLATDLRNLGEVLNVYVPGLRHLLIVLPGLLEANGSAQVYYPDQVYGESGLSFKLTVNDPPVCVDGFPEAGHKRSPHDLRTVPLPANSYCKVEHSDPRIVRGARNMPCPHDPDRRGARAVDCGLVFHEKELTDE